MMAENAARLRELLQTHEGLLIASPEYNSGIPALLKNTIDWTTRTPEATPDTSGYGGKLVALMAASPGPLGGMRALVMVRSILTNIGCTVLAEQITIRQAASAFAEDGQLKDAGYQKRSQALGSTLADWLRKLQADL